MACLFYMAHLSDFPADVSAARAALGHAPRTSLEEGIARFVAWLREQR
jgi:nucleoside-diphosphate-sugar epimerase